MAAQSREEPQPYSFPARIITYNAHTRLPVNNTYRMMFLLVLLSSIIDIKLLSGRNMKSLRSNLGSKLVNQTNISEGSTSHNLIISASSTISVEILGSQSTTRQESSSRRGLDNVIKQEASKTLAIDPAGEMWSVVTESPRFNKQYAFSMLDWLGRFWVLT